MPAITSEQIQKLIDRNEAKKLELTEKFEAEAKEFEKVSVENRRRVQETRHELNLLQADIERHEEMCDEGLIPTQERDELVRPLKAKKDELSVRGEAADDTYKRLAVKAEAKLNEMLEEQRRIEKKLEDYREMLDEAGPVQTVAVTASP